MSREGEGKSRGTGRSKSATQGPKRPTATLDLEATEVKSEETREKSVKPETAAQSKGAQTKNKSATKNGDQNRESLKTRLTSVLQDMPDLRNIGSHLAAGIAGGIVILIGYSFFADPGTPAKLQEQITADFENRLQEIEESVNELDPDSLIQPLNEKVSAISGRLDNIEESAKDLSEVQKVLKHRSAKLEKELARTGSVSSQSEQRLAKLEKTLGSLSAEGQSGEASRLGQAAALSARITELENLLNEKLTSLEKEVEKKLAQISEEIPSESPPQVTQQEIEAVKRSMQAGTDRLNQDLLTAKSDARLLGEEVSTVRSQSLKLANELKELRSKIIALSGQALKSEDLKGELSPIAGRVDSLERKVVKLIANDEKQQASARQTALPVAVNNLKRAIDKGSAFSEELELVERLAPVKLQTGRLNHHAVMGVYPLAVLQDSFPSVIRKIISSGSETNDETFVGRFISSARSVVRIRKTGDIEGTGTEAVIARMEVRLKNNDLEGALRESRGLKGPALKAAETWLEQARSRLEVNNALEKLERQLLTAFAGDNVDSAKEN